ncbi:twin-arginine translocation signal domain-containing protein [Halorubrum vacuolatum]|uniref:TAT (Twin-arginine translocation) pathway signal sequence n=1 Tax=Halorubrum vacuolatum TaxID=63740 RepID=A0A238X2L1_HALVU|nr:twin-arginine translocation signal domain-containing protein [Halorubrum vacuolatum]SNR53205.1 TAT (twin-arginine translocation) pathway signal sequence [Halorubrum vacuolatum]
MNREKVNKRQFLKGLGGLGATAGLAGCGDTGNGSPSDGSSDTSDTGDDIETDSSPEDDGKDRDDDDGEVEDEDQFEVVDAEVLGAYDSESDSLNLNIDYEGDLDEGYTPDVRLNGEALTNLDALEADGSFKVEDIDGMLEGGEGNLIIVDGNRVNFRVYDSWNDIEQAEYEFWRYRADRAPRGAEQAARRIFDPDADFSDKNTFMEEHLNIINEIVKDPEYGDGFSGAIDWVYPILNVIHIENDNKIRLSPGTISHGFTKIKSGHETDDQGYGFPLITADSNYPAVGLTEDNPLDERGQSNVYGDLGKNVVGEDFEDLDTSGRRAGSMMWNNIIRVPSAGNDNVVSFDPSVMTEYLDLYWDGDGHILFGKVRHALGTLTKALANGFVEEDFSDHYNGDDEEELANLMITSGVEDLPSPENFDNHGEYAEELLHGGHVEAYAEAAFWKKLLDSEHYYG